MAFVSLGDSSSAKPTFFEISAADSLMPSLKAATIYSLSVMPRKSIALHLAHSCHSNTRLQQFHNHFLDT